MEFLPLGLLLSLVWDSGALPTRARTPLTIQPKDPLVEIGGSIQLQCSLDCPGGKVQWEGLDTDLGNIISNHTSSILTVTKASVRMGGMKICTGQCQGEHYQKTVELLVYSLPDSLQLDTRPQVPTAGQPAHFICSASHVYPEGAFTLSWFRGDERVERPMDEDIDDSDLLTYRSELEIPMAVERTTYRCEGTLTIGQRLFRQSRTVTIQAQEMQERAPTAKTTSFQMPLMTVLLGTTERPIPTTDGKSSLEATTGSLLPVHSTERPTVMKPLTTTTAAPGLDSLTSPTTGRHLSTGSPSTVQLPWREALTDSSKPTGLFSTSGKPSMWTLTPVPETLATLGVASMALPATDQQPAAEPVPPTDGLPTKSTAAAKRPNHTVTAQEGLCRPGITTFPPQGTMGAPLRITCHALECRKGIQVQWAETPVALSQYYQEKAEAQSALAVDRVSSEHQGVYRCIVTTSQPRMASVRIVVETDDASSTNAVITIGAAGSLLGLFVASYVSRRVWQRHGS